MFGLPIFASGEFVGHPVRNSSVGWEVSKVTTVSLFTLFIFWCFLRRVGVMDSVGDNACSSEIAPPRMTTSHAPCKYERRKSPENLNHAGGDVGASRTSGEVSEGNGGVSAPGQCGSDGVYICGGFCGRMGA